MTSIGPYTQSMNFTHMYDMPDLRGNRDWEVCPNSLLDIIKKNKDFSLYDFLVNKAGFYKILMENAANFTLFIPSDEYIKKSGLEQHILSLDKAEARNLILSTMLNNRITSDLLCVTDASVLKTRNQPNNLYVKCLDNSVVINDYAKIVQFDIQATNGIIHVIDKVLFPILR